MSYQWLYIPKSIDFGVDGEPEPAPGFAPLCHVCKEPATGSPFDFKLLEGDNLNDQLFKRAVCDVHNPINLKPSSG